MEAPAARIRRHPEPDEARRPFWAAGALVVLAAIGATSLYRRMQGGSGGTVRRVDELRELAGTQVIGVVPTFGARSRTARPRPDAAATDAYRALRLALRPARVVVITSARSGDGKTTSAANLARIMAAAGDRVLLIDAETRRGDQHAVFGVAAEPGFFDLLFGQAAASDCIRHLGGDAPFDLLPSGGASQANAESLLLAGGLAAFLDGLRPSYDVILIDSPPLESFADAARLGAHADAVVFVARAGRTPRRAIVAAVRQLRDAHANLVGAVLNDAARHG